MRFAISRRRLGRSGAAALEFALVGGAFFLMVLGAMDLGRYFMTLHSLHTVLGNAVRAALVDQTFSGCPATATQVAAAAPLLQPSQITLCVARTSASGVNTITVTASYQFNFVLPNWVSSSGTLTDTTSVSY
jgi:Flp pilus assembly protein TadG